MNKQYWKSAELGYLSSIHARVGWKNLTADEYTNQGHIFLAIPNIRQNPIDFINVNYISEKRYRESPDLALKTGDVLIAKDGSTLGSINIVTSLPQTATVNGSIAILRTKSELTPRFLRYYLESKDIQSTIEFYRQGSGVPHLYQAHIKKFKINYPSIAAQQAIADFLDSKTAAIDALIAKKQRLLELLEEKRAALINRAVTKGLNPDVPMKDSGIPWIGEIPAHWDVARLKFLASKIIDCLHSTPEYIEDGPCYAIRTSDIEIGHLDLSKAKRVSTNTFKTRTKRAKITKGDIIYSREGERFGLAAPILENLDICMAQRVIQIKSNNTTQSGFLMWSLNCDSTYNQAKQDTVGATSPRVNIETIANMWIPRPLQEEQKHIAIHIKKTISEQTHLKKKINNQIERLQEYRQALITAAVTGQLDITGEDD